MEEAVMGVKRAAQRKLDHELGIKTAQVPFENFKFLTRIHYKAPSDGKWGEHESKSYLRNSADTILSSCDHAVDYILFIKANVDLEPNLNEVRDTKYVTADELKTMFNDPTLKFTPWFKLICHSLLFEWWKHLDAGLEKYMNEQEIRRM